MDEDKIKLWVTRIGLTVMGLLTFLVAALIGAGLVRAIVWIWP